MLERRLIGCVYTSLVQQFADNLRAQGADGASCGATDEPWNGDDDIYIDHGPHACSAGGTGSNSTLALLGVVLLGLCRRRSAHSTVNDSRE